MYVHRSGRRASAIKALYLVSHNNFDLPAHMTSIDPPIINPLFFRASSSLHPIIQQAEAAGFGADDINDNEDQMKKVEGVELGGPWLKDEKMRAWVRQVLMASEKGNKWREKDKEMVMEGMKAQKHTRVEEEDDVEKE